MRIRSRAAHGAALLFVAVISTALIAPADAKMRIDRLWLVPASGQEVPIDIEIAQAPEEKSLGLMFRTELADNEGMLFPYGEPRELSMWMHNTYIPLDMLFIRPDGVIHRIETRAEPLSDRVISSGGEVSAVLELPGGAAARLGIKAGDRVRHPLFTAPKP
ncbi:DUF192 domain-containing protein [Hyphomicrobium sp.]|uniref:DUF192 domain-containing protein n=1 Tax=Hyphomicrobium sp. TaxID=82 RepID=UPI0022C042C1|nr:DUF192 domain-containing protein [Hyphomicrobium sp.]MCZ7595209.1 DUF192 domain-containing protein [Hyphomicrobium sp.]